MADFETLYRLDQACFEEGVAYTREELRQFLALAWTAANAKARELGWIA